MRSFNRRLFALEGRLKAAESSKEIPIVWVDLETGERRQAPDLIVGGKPDYRIGLATLELWDDLQPLSPIMQRSCDEFSTSYLSDQEQDRP